MQIWPTQAEVDGFYGNPRGVHGAASRTWETQNLASFTPPFQMHYALQPIQHFKIHAKCHDSLARVFALIWQAAGRQQNLIDQWGVSIFGGSYNFRLMRNSTKLSMHSYACAIDLAPDRFPMGAAMPCFAPPVVSAFQAEGWINLPHDRMHFQAARLK